MRHYSYLRLSAYSVLFASILFSGGCKKSQTYHLTLSLMTYNVAGLPEGLSSSHPATYTSSISPLLNGQDLIHVQEDFCYHDSLLLFDHHPYRTITEGCVPNGDGLNAFSNFPISNVDRHPWTNCTGADCLTPKGFYFSQLTLITGDTLDVYDVHCNAGSSDASFSARRANIEQLCNYINDHSGGKPVLIMGDFNSKYTRDQDSIRALLSMGFTDVWVKLIRDGDVPAYSPNKLDDCDPVRTSPNCERVDKVFFRSNSHIEFTPLSYQVDDSRFYYQGNDTLPLSDHWPVFVQMDIKINPR